MLREAADLLMPRECPVCGRLLSSRERFLCLMCSTDLPLTYYWQKARNPMADRLNATLEAMRPDGIPLRYASAAALAFYHAENPYKIIPRALKYDGNVSLGRAFSRMLGRYLLSSRYFSGVDLVIPVPLHFARRYARGYNQAAVIAGEIASVLGADFLPGALQRTRKTNSQTSLDAEDRISNVSGAFRLKDGAARRIQSAKHILLVDDTFTTGATLAACILAFPPSCKISVATLAVVDNL